MFNWLTLLRFRNNSHDGKSEPTTARDFNHRALWRDHKTEIYPCNSCDAEGRVTARRHPPTWVLVGTGGVWRKGPPQVRVRRHNGNARHPPGGALQLHHYGSVVGQTDDTGETGTRTGQTCRSKFTSSRSDGSNFTNLLHISGTDNFTPTGFLLYISFQIVKYTT